MFKFSPPIIKVILSSGSFLTLIALSCLIVMSTSVHTSDIENRSDDTIGAAAPGNTTTSTASNSNGDQQDASARQETKPAELRAGDSRHRSGRMYQTHAQQQQQQSPLESYAAAYAAANSGGGGGGVGADQSALTQQSVAVGSQSSDSSFGEAAPQPLSTPLTSGQSASSIARQLSTNPIDYNAHTGYFAGYMSPSSNEASYSGAAAGYPHSGPSQHHIQHNHHKAHHHHHHHQQQHNYHQQQQSSQVGQLPLGYPSLNGLPYEQRAFSPMSPSSYYDRVAHSSAASSPFWATSSPFGGSSGGGGAGLMSSASHALSHWTNGFSIGEIICGLVAIAIGAIILGAPFFLIYLALMGNFSGSGTLSLTNPTSATGAAGGAAAPSNGRRKRLAVFEAMNMGEQASNKHPDLAAIVDSVAKSVGPYVNLQQVSSTFKQLVRSIEKYSSASAPHDKSAKA